MTTLETILVILLSLWTLIFIALGIFLVVLFFQVKQALNKINQMIETADRVSGEVGSSLKTLAGSFAALTAKNIVSSIGKKIMSRRKDR